VHIWESLQEKEAEILDANALVQIKLEGDALDEEWRMQKVKTKEALKEGKFQCVIKLCTAAVRMHKVPKPHLAWFYTSRAAAIVNMHLALAEGARVRLNGEGAHGKVERTKGRKVHVNLHGSKESVWRDREELVVVEGVEIAALGDANKALDYEPDWETALLIKGNALLKLERWEDAVSTLHHVLGLQEEALRVAFLTEGAGNTHERKESKVEKTRKKLETCKVVLEKQARTAKAIEDRKRKQEEERRRVKAEQEKKIRATEEELARKLMVEQELLQRAAEEKARLEAEEAARIEAEKRAAEEMARLEAEEKAKKAAEEQARKEAEEQRRREEEEERIMRQREGEAAEQVMMVIEEEASRAQMGVANEGRELEEANTRREAEAKVLEARLLAQSVAIHTITSKRHSNTLGQAFRLWRFGCRIILRKSEVQLALLSPMTTEAKLRNAAFRPPKQIDSRSTLLAASSAGLVCASCSCADLVMAAKPSQLLSPASVIAGIGVGLTAQGSREWQRRSSMELPTPRSTDLRTALRGQVDWGVMGGAR
jgi:hypothetical protein